MRLDELLHHFIDRCATGIMTLEHFCQRLLGQQPGLLFGQDGHLGIDLQFVKVGADQLQAKAVKRTDVRCVEQR